MSIKYFCDICGEETRYCHYIKLENEHKILCLNCNSKILDLFEHGQGNCHTEGN